MSHPIVRSDRLHAMFAMLTALSDSAILEIIQGYETGEIQEQSVLKAFKALTEVAPCLPDTFITPVSRVGIVGASSVTTAYWPYLILATALGIRVKIKMPPLDVHHIAILSEIISLASDRKSVGDLDYCCDWDVSIQPGLDLVDHGYWDDCDRLLVFGTDASVDHYRHKFPEPGRIIGFGHIESVTLVTLDSLQADSRWIDDLLAFGHVGCLAPRVVIPIEDTSAEAIAKYMSARLHGLVSPDIARAVTLRSKFHSLRVAGTDAWLSQDGMWLISDNDSLPSSAISGHLNIISWNTLVTSGCIIGALSTPFFSDDLSLGLYPAAAWKCAWGMAQFPTMLWANGGIPLIASLFR